MDTFNAAATPIANTGSNTNNAPSATVAAAAATPTALTADTKPFIPTPVPLIDTPSFCSDALNALSCPSLKFSPLLKMFSISASILLTFLMALSKPLSITVKPLPCIGLLLLNQLPAASANFIALMSFIYDLIPRIVF